MKKILSAIGVIFVIGIIISVISSCSACSGCNSCNGCGGCNDKNNNNNNVYIPPAEPTVYFTLVVTDGTDGTQAVEKQVPNKGSLGKETMERTGYQFKGVFSTVGGGGIQYYSETGSQLSQPQQGERLYVYWEAQTYKFVYKVGETVLTGTDDEVVYGGDVPDSFPVPSSIPAGKEFIGWQNSKGVLVSDSTGAPLSASLTDKDYPLNDQNKTVELTALIKDKTYKVTYVFGGTTENKVVEVKPETTLELPDVTVGAGKEFLGWSYEENSTLSSDFYNNEPITQDVTLYAITLSYKDIPVMEGEKVLDQLRVYDDGKSIVLNTVEVKLTDGYEVSGWYSSPTMSGSTKLNSLAYSNSYTAVYVDIQPITYTATLNLGSGETCSSASVSYDIENEAALPVAQKTNYTFIGWCTDAELTSKSITKIEKGNKGDINLYPKFKGKDVRLTLNARNGNPSTSATKEYGKEFDLAVPVFNGYLFLGWFGSAEGGEKYTDGTGKSLKALDLTEDTQLYAHWSKKYFVNVTVTPASAGKVTVKEYYLEGDKVELIFATPTGYSLTGWFDNSDSLVSGENIYEFDMPASNVDLTLKFEPEQYTVTFDCLDGEYDNTPVTVTFGEPFTLPKVIKAAYRFLGWQYNETTLTDGEGKSTANWNLTSNVTVSAILVQMDDSQGTLIYDSATLLKVKDNPAGTYQVVYNVNMEGVEWTPFAFTGKMVGNGYTIKNLTVSPSSVMHTGMFTSVSGTIEDLNFENLDVTLTATDYTNYYAVGGVCGTLSGTLKNITVKSGQIVGGTNFNYAGGLVGSMTGGTVTGCKNYASVTSTSDYGAGGIVARFSGGTINDNENYGSVTGTINVGGLFGVISASGNYSILSLKNSGEVSGKDYVGGIAGDIKDYISVYTSSNPTYTLTLTNLTNNGNVTGEGYVGGIAGRIHADASNTWGSGRYARLKIAASYFTNTGKVTGKSYTGGLTGYCYSNEGSSTLSNGVSSGTIEAEYYVGGLVGKIENVKISDSSNENTVINATGYYLDTNNGTYYAYVGGYAGFGYAFENCENGSVITYTNRGIYVGGIAGYANGAITKCTNTGNVTATDSDYVGGLAGYITLSGNASLVTLTNSGAVKGKNYSGGIFGYVNDYISVYTSENPTYTLTLTNLTNNGSVTGGENYAGGIAGRIQANADNRWGSGRYARLKIAAAYLTNTGNVKGKAYIGGLTGQCYSNESSSTLSNGVSSGTIEAEYYVGGLAGKIENVKISDSSNANTVLKATGFYLDGTTYRGYIGGYAGYGYAFENCENAVNITYTARGNDVGGIAGHAEGIITNCTNKGNIIASGSSYVGGIAGYVGLSGTITLSELTNSGEVSGKDYVGGIFGQLSDNITVYTSSNPTYTLTLTNLNNSGKVTGASNVGGVIGRVYATASNTWGSGRYARMKLAAAFIINSGNVMATSNAGGLFGYATSNESSSTIMEYTQTGTVTGTGENVDNLIGYKENISFVS